jgi:4-amino-4-deoxy-L-arabinose transferase-like glycosyltransferase
MGESESVLTAESGSLAVPRCFGAVGGAEGQPLGSVENRQNDVRRTGLATVGVLLFALAALVPTVGDFGLTWDEPAYRYSQVLSAQWWEQLVSIRSWSAFAEVFDPDALLYFWPYGRFGINFHPPLAGQLNLASHAIFGSWMKDIPSRRMASVLEFAVTIALGFRFLARRYGMLVGLGMAGSLLLMPRLYGQAHLMDTDIPGLFLWSATAMAFWKGLHESHARRWRVAVGILLGLAFIEKMGAVMVLLPLVLWLFFACLPRSLTRLSGRFDWIDGLVTTGAMLVPLGLAFQQIQLMQQRLPPPGRTDLFIHRPVSDLPGAILVLPLLVWLVRRLLGRLFPANRVWGVERPALETWTAILAFGPVIGWLGNPAWWREALPRLAHYYTLNAGRQGALPNIQIIYFGQVYEFSLPWHNAWVLMAITVPVATLAAGLIGLCWSMGQIRRDRLPLYFLIHFVTLPVIRMFPTPAHDGVRLFLPTFFFLAAFAGWGMTVLADALARTFRFSSAYSRPVVVAAALGSAAFALVRIHPYELSYYNELPGGPRGAWNRGFELTYWYDAFTDKVIADLNRKLPPEAEIDYFNPQTEASVIVFQELQSLGALRGDISLAARLPNQFPFVWLLTHDSKAVAFTRLLFALRPWYASQPTQLAGAQVAAVADPVAVSRAYALKTLLDAGDLTKPPPPAAPAWVREHVPWLSRLWGDGLIRPKKLTVNPQILEWSRSDPAGLLAAAQRIAARRPDERDENARRLMDIMTAEPNLHGPRHYLVEQVLDRRPEALVEAIQIVNAHRDEVVKVMTRQAYTDLPSIGGYLDRDLPTFATISAQKK